MNKFKRDSAAVLVALTLWGVAGACHGMGFGHPVTRAILGDTLSVSVPVRLDANEELSPECVKAEVFFGDDKVPPRWVQTQLNVSAAPVGRTADHVIQIRTTAFINEPVVTVSVAAGCRAMITRKWVTLVDPPDWKPPTVSESVPAAGMDGASRPEATRPVGQVQDPVSSSSGLGHQAPSFSISGGRARSVHSGQKVARARRHTADRPAAQIKTAQAVPRLVLDPVATDALVSPDLQMTAGLADVAQASGPASPELERRRHAAAAVWQAMSATTEELARDRDRLENLEHKLNALSQDSVRASEAVSGLQSRLLAQASPSGGRGVVDGLVAAVVLLAALLVWREWSLRRALALAERNAWLTSRTHEDEVTPADVQRQADSLLPSIDEVVAQADAEMAQSRAKAGPPSQVPIYDVPEPVTREPLARAGGVSEQPAAEHVDVAKQAALPTMKRQDSLRDVSVDELIDLEQQAEFFLVLGQDESAIEVLEGYIQSTTAASPMPFLKLLEIYRQLEMRGAYERTRMNFNLRFNAHAPLWDADPVHGHELKDYPGVVERLQALWSYPDKALAVLERSLMRQDAESYTFDLPAYRELLFLYSVLRDLVERHADDGATHMAHGHAHLMVSSQPGGHFAVPAGPTQVEAVLDTDSPLMATLPMKALPDLAPTLSLDLELDDLIAPEHDAAYKP